MAYCPWPLMHGIERFSNRAIEPGKLLTVEGCLRIVTIHRVTDAHLSVPIGGNTLSVA